MTPKITNSLIAAPRKTNPRISPTVSTEVSLKRRTSMAISNQAIPVMRNTHHSLVTDFSPLAICSSVTSVVMSGTSCWW
jgi:hypothetical protein